MMTAAMYRYVMFKHIMMQKLMSANVNSIFALFLSHFLETALQTQGASAGPTLRAHFFYESSRSWARSVLPVRASITAPTTMQNTKLKNSVLMERFTIFQSNIVCQPDDGSHDGAHEH
jgi:hypothetical protein